MATIAFISLGCDKNSIDSEIMLSLLVKRGHTITKHEEEAQVIVVNTCSFISDAKEESINTLIEMGEWKESGKLEVLVCAGCLAERYATQIKELLPEVDVILGCGSYEAIADAVEEALSSAVKRPLEIITDPSKRDLSATDRILLTPGYYEYLKIAEGCDNHCTYCVIPRLRGRFQSRSEEDILKEAEDLARQGVKELNLVAQDITKYGQDQSPPSSLAALLRKLCKVEGIAWIRLLYCYPEDITDELIEVIASEEKVLPYLDIPIQHCNDEILRRMGRHHDQNMLLSLLRRLRAAIPQIALRTTLITGFPGESEEAFLEMKAFIEEAKFDRLGVFAYSKEEGTPAARMKNQIPQKEKERRKEILMETQREVSKKLSERFVGKELTVLVEGRLPGEEGEDGFVYATRTFRDAPEIDGFLFLTSKEELSSGDMVKAKVLLSHEYDLIGELL